MTVLYKRHRFPEDGTSAYGNTEQKGAIPETLITNQKSQEHGRGTINPKNTGQQLGISGTRNKNSNPGNTEQESAILGTLNRN